tara:strand:- start:10636 stop:11289 length:654 start_codon:yes stop_codon:yes gene_type:complete
MIKAVIFDMDGLIIDSQPYWQDAQLEVLPKVGVTITRQDTIDTTGMRIDHIVEACYRQSPWKEPSRGEVCRQILDRVTELVRQHKPAMPGLEHAIAICRQLNLRLAIASSSPTRLIDATVDALNLHGVFETQSSGESLIHAKPHPEVYLNACDALGLSPPQCVAFEDSFVGLLAAKAASMKAIIIPESNAADDKRFVIADHQLSSLEELTTELLQTI